MADDNTPPEGGQNGADNGAGGDGGFKPITSQDQLDRIIGDRVARVRSQFGDYDDLKAKAATVDEWQTKATGLEAQVAEVPTRVTAGLRDAIVSLGVVPETRKVLLTAGTPEGLLEQVKAIRDIETAATPPRRTATPPGKPATGDGKGRAAAALRELRGTRT